MVKWFKFFRIKSYKVRKVRILKVEAEEYTVKILNNYVRKFLVIMN